MEKFSACIHRDHLIVVFVDLRTGKYGFHAISPSLEWSQCENADRCRSIEAAVKVAKCMIDLDIAIDEAKEVVNHAK